MEIEKVTDDPQLGTLLQRAGEIKERLDEGKGETAELREQLTQVKAAIDENEREKRAKADETERAQLRRDIDAIMSQQRTPSKAAQVAHQASAPAEKDEHFFAAIAYARSRDYQEQQYGKARLEEMGSTFSLPDPTSKATLGTTAALGGYLVPNATVAAINEQATPSRSVVDLFTQVNGIRGGSIQLPWEPAGPTRAVIQLPGGTKENVDITVNAYSATLYTLARIFDVDNRLLRQSEGAVEALVRSKLARAFGLGEDYYALNGSGTNEPYGLLTAIPAGPYSTAFSSPSQSTVAGSTIAAVLQGAGIVANRGGVVDGVVLNTSDFYLTWAQGSNEAGFFSDPYRAIPGSGADSTGPGGFRWRHSPNMTADTIVVGEFQAAWFIRGDGYRVDVSSEAGTRWDTNQTGFRGEEEIAFDARPAVYAGRFQRMTNTAA